MFTASTRVLGLTLTCALPLLAPSAVLPAEGPSFIVTHRYDGQIERVDPKTGAVTVATRAGSVKLEESTPRAGRLNKGGYVTVEIAIFGGTPPADRVRPVDPTLLRKRSTVDVVRVDRTAGTMRLIWPPSSTLTVDVPHEMLKRFKKGDRVPVELVVDLAPPPAASAPTESRRRGALATFILGILGKK